VTPRKPRTQSVASIKRLPAGFTSPSCTTPWRHLTQTPSLVSRIWPGCARDGSISKPIAASMSPSSAITFTKGAMPIRALAKLAHAPGFGVVARNHRSASIAEELQRTLASVTCNLGANETPWVGRPRVICVGIKVSEHFGNQA